MCGLFGFSFYGTVDKFVTTNKFETLLKELGHASTVRGTQATGIAYNDNNKMHIIKDAVSAYEFKFNVPKNATKVIGHTRRTTKGSEKENYNNHPFLGYTPNKTFAFAHNGVLDNELELSKKYNFPYTEIETDSYAAVQVLEQLGEFSVDSIKKMAEEVEGMFTFTLLDENDNLYIVKNDSPFHMVHFPDLKVYLYASTQEILMEALMQSYLTKNIIMDVLKGSKEAKAQMEWIEPVKGDILVVNSLGEISKSKFNPKWRTKKASYSYGYYNTANYTASKSETKALTAGTSTTVTTASKPATTSNNTGLSLVKNNSDTASASQTTSKVTDPEYYEALIRLAENKGVARQEVEELRKMGFGIMQIEDMIYDGTVFSVLNQNGIYYPI